MVKYFFMRIYPVSICLFYTFSLIPTNMSTNEYAYEYKSVQTWVRSHKTMGDYYHKYTEVTTRENEKEWERMREKKRT